MHRGGAPFISEVLIDDVGDRNDYPFDLPIVRHLARRRRLKLTTPVTFLVGDNGTGKSTFVEALAVTAGFNAEGGSKSFRFTTKATESVFSEHLTLAWKRRPNNGFFLRAESFYNVASEVDRLVDEGGSGLLASYGGRSLHERSHGESFLALATNRFGPRGLYILDEPEAALSVTGCLALVRRIMELAEQDCQFIVATHSPIVMAVPGATILQIDIDGEIEAVDYDRTDTVLLTRRFLDDPKRFIEDLYGDDYV
ncbi:AAA family ATPase [Smaragdicoccus niigatensis]|uniref:AAA family ATPase n=1 Tax=Smaragdicoccus niigatensis TaxID=359359 RepID=UPI000360CFBC|nr:AAA family ATPase [Smaragdicoccus niigatensis]